jgi:hypothetical protein
MSESDEEDVPEEESSKPPEHFYKRMLALLDGLCSSVDFLGDETLMKYVFRCSASHHSVPLTLAMFVQLD